MGTHPPLKNEHLVDVCMNTAREDTHVEKERIYLEKILFVDNRASL